ncbi:hypothetical protein ACK346_02650 [Aeromonas veronii]
MHHLNFSKIKAREAKCCLFFFTLIGLTSLFKYVFITYISAIQLVSVCVGLLLSLVMFRHRSVNEHAFDLFVISVFIFVYIFSAPKDFINSFSLIAVVYLSLTYYHLSNGKFNMEFQKAIYFTLFVSCIIMFLVYLKNGFLIDSGVDFLLVFDGGLMNRNLTKELLAYPLFTYFIVSITYELKVKKIIPALCSIILILSNSRVGIVLGVVGLICLMLFLLREKKLGILILILILIFYIAMRYVNFQTDAASGLMNGFHRLSQSGNVLDPRENVIQCYANSFDVFKLIFGLHFNSDDACAWAAGVADANPHNSFINGYVYFGILFPFFIMWLFISFVNTLRFKFDVIVLLCIFSLFLTSFFERNMFPSLFDGLVISSVLIYIKSLGIKNNRNS